VKVKVLLAVVNALRGVPAWRVYKIETELLLCVHLKRAVGLIRRIKVRALREGKRTAHLGAVL
jgi:hypothetical protein